MNAVDGIIAEQAVPARAALVNLFHVDALATFGDSMGAFIDESAMQTIRHEPSTHSRAWKITAGVVAGDLLLVGFWLATRKRDEAADEARSKSRYFPFCNVGLAHR